VIEEQFHGLTAMSPVETGLVRKGYKEIRLLLIVFVSAMPFWACLVVWGAFMSEIGMIVGGAIPLVMFIGLIIGFALVIDKYARDLRENIKVSIRGLVEEKEERVVKSTAYYTIRVAGKMFDLTPEQYNSVNKWENIEIQASRYSLTVVNIVKTPLPEPEKKKKKKAA